MSLLDNKKQIDGEEQVYFQNTLASIIEDVKFTAEHPQ